MIDQILNWIVFLAIPLAWVGRGGSRASRVACLLFYPLVLLLLFCANCPFEELVLPAAILFPWVLILDVLARRFGRGFKYSRTTGKPTRKEGRQRRCSAD